MSEVTLYQGAVGRDGGAVPVDAVLVVRVLEVHHPLVPASVREIVRERGRERESGRVSEREFQFSDRVRERVR